MRSAVLGLMAALVAGCSSMPTGQDAVSWSCHKELTAYRNQPPMTDQQKKERWPQEPPVPVSEPCARELSR
jgi:type IV pilus biogenesis protein CpaD/CtpE